MQILIGETMKLKNLATFALALVLGVFSFGVIGATVTSKPDKSPPKVEFVKMIECPSNNITAFTVVDIDYPTKSLSFGSPEKNSPLTQISNPIFTAMDFGERVNDSSKLKQDKTNPLFDSFRKTEFYKLE